MDGIPAENKTPQKRAPRKRVVVDDAGISAEARAPRKRATRKAVTETDMTPVRPPRRVKRESETAFDVSTTSTRKAPTRFAGLRTFGKERRKQQLVVGAVLLFGLVSSAAIGFTDKGKIDIDKAIDEHNQRLETTGAATAEGNEETSHTEVPVQHVSKFTGATLVGRGTGGTKKPEATPAAAASSTATSTGSVATSSATTTDGAVGTSTEDVSE